MLHYSLMLDPETQLALYNNHGNELVDALAPSEGIECYRAALAINPNHAVVLFNLGRALALIGDHVGAVASYRRSIELKAWQPDCQFNLAEQLLLLGEWQEGWRLYEWRKRQPRWLGTAYIFYPLHFAQCFMGWFEPRVCLPHFSCH